jgi:hypothetical protein
MNRKFWAGLLIGLGLVLVLLFGFRLAHAIGRWGAPPPPQALEAATDTSLIREWMTIPYVARTFGVPEGALFEALGIPERQNRWKNLVEINKEYFPEQAGLVVARVQEVVLAFQAQAPLPSIPGTSPTAPTP